MKKNLYLFLRVCLGLTLFSFWGLAAQAQELNIKAITVNEDVGFATFSVTLSPASGNVVTVDYTTTDNGAIAPDDYTATSGKLTFPANSTTPQTIKVPIVNDFISETTEGFTIVLSNASNATLPTSSAYCTLLDDDAKIDIAGQATISESAGIVNIPVNLSIPVPYEVKVDYTTADGNAIGGEDFAAKTGTITFPPNSTVPQIITINITDETVYDPGEYFTVTLSNPQKGSIGSPTTYVYITDNEIQLHAGQAVYVNEGAGEALFKFTLPAAVPYEVKVDYTTVEATATSPGDFTAKSGTVTFPANSSAAQTISVPITDDNTFNSNKYFYIQLSNPVNATLGNTDSYAYITDNDVVVDINPAQLTLEGAGTALFTATLSAPSAQQVTVTYTTSDNSATAPDDYTATTGTITFPPGSVGPVSFTVPIVDDNVFDDYEGFTVTLSNAVNATIGNASVLAYILDNDTQINLSTPLAVAENGGNLTFSLYLTTPVDHVVTVNYATSDGNATQPGDYTAKTGTVTFPANSTAPQTVTVPIIDDSDYDPGEYLNLELSNAVGGSISNGYVSGYIIDNDAQISITSSVTVKENAGNASLTIVLSNPVDHVVTVNYITSDGAATTPGDYTAASGTVTFPANSIAPQTISIPVIDDTEFEPTEYFTVTLENSNGASIASGSSSVYITDNEAQVSLFSSITVKENAGNAIFTAYLTSPVSYEVKVNYSTHNSSANAPGDFTAKSGTLTFPANSIEPINITIPIIADAAAESDEQFYVTLDNPINASVGNSTQYCTITEQAAANSIIDIVSNSAVSEAAGNLTVLISLSQANSQAVTVNYSTANGNALDGSDYTFTSGTLTFPANTTAPLTITIPITDDFDYDPGEYFTVTLSGASNATIGNGTLYAYITDDDAQINLDPNQITVSEKDGNATFVARLSQQVPYEVTVDYTTSDSGALNGEDYSATSGTITFPANSAGPQTFSIPILNDAIYESSEAFSITLSNPVKAAIGNGNGYVTINDDDGFVSFEPSYITISEGAGSATFTVRLSQPLSQTVTVNYATADNGAVEGSDYTATSGTVTFPANSVTPQTISVPLINDSQSEGQEQFSITLSDPTNASLGGNTIAYAGITDDDASLYINPNTIYVSEGAGTATFSVTISRPVPNEVRVDYTTVEGYGAVAGEDYTTTTGTLIFPANSTAPQTITVPIINNLNFEYNEGFAISLSNAVNASFDNGNAYAYITDNDATINVDPYNITVSEDGGNATFTVTLSQAVSVPVTVDYTTSDNGAIAGQDYTATSGTLTFPANSAAPQSFTVPVIDDKVYDPGENFSVTLSNAVNASIQNAYGYASITDNDATISIDPTSVNGSEANGTATFTATISQAVPYEVKVDYTTIDGGSSTAGTDYTTSSGTLTFPANSTIPQSFTIPVTDDLLYDPNEYLYVNLLNPVNASIQNNSGYAMIIDNDPKINLDPAAVSFSESGGTANFTVTLSDAVPFDVTVNYKTTAGTATEGTDYTGKTGTVYFPAYSNTPQTIAIEIKDDFDYENNETFTVTLSNPTGGFLGNIAATGTINDNDLEIASTPAALTVSCAGDVPTASPASITVNNHCGDTPVITITDVTAPGFTCANRYVITRTWTVKNNCGNNKTTSQVITVDDQIAPVITGTPATLNVSCAADVPAASIGAVNATDNCAGTVTVTVADATTPGSCANKYSIVRTWTATDVCGNKSTTSQTINVNDNIAPVIAGTPANITVTCAADVTTASISSVTATDNCIGTVTVTVADVITPGSCANKYSITRTWSATDVCGNKSTSSQTITVDDNIAPVLSGTPAALTVTCAADVPTASITGLTATDNCTGTVTITVADVTNPGSCANKFTVTRTWTATDICGNKSTTSQTITVDDNIAPVISGTPAAVTVSCTANVPPASIGSVTATDNCAGTATVTVADVTTAGSCVNKFTITRTWTATDICGNKTTSSQLITVNDNVVPLITTCTPNQTLSTDANVCTYTVKNNTLNPAASDNCSDASGITFKFTLSGVTTSTAGQYTSLNGVVFNKGVTTVSVTAVDACGNESLACSFTMTVSDKQAPAKPTLAAVTGQCTVTVTATPTTTDNCGGTITGSTTSPLTYTGFGEHTIVWTFDDGNGNVTTADQIVTITDNVAPAKPTLADVTGICTVTPVAPTTTDNCAGTVTATTTTTFPITFVGTTVVTWTFDDGHGNVVTADQKVIVSGSDMIATSATTTVYTFSADENYAYDDNCQLLTKIVPINLEGEVTSSVWIENDNVSGPYVQRHYQISPAQNAAASSATITLYFTQAEFDKYNAIVTDKLPTKADDKAGIANLRIVKFAGNSTDQGGLSYAGESTMIDPVDTDIVFVNGRWEVTFTVTGFSGFFVNSVFTPLPVTLVSFSGRKISEMENTLNWVTADEVGFKGFQVQRSADAKHFETVGWVDHQANVTGVFKTYQFIDKNAAYQSSYYRLNMIDHDGTQVFSKIINIDNAPERSVVGQVYPNPSVGSKVDIDVVAAEPGSWTIIIYDLTGRTMKEETRKLTKGINKLDVQLDNLPLGTSLIRIEENNKEVHIRKVTKQ
jgi:hypothetical protein